MQQKTQNLNKILSAATTFRHSAILFVFVYFDFNGKFFKFVSKAKMNETFAVANDATLSLIKLKEMQVITGKFNFIFTATRESTNLTWRSACGHKDKN